MLDHFQEFTRLSQRWPEGCSVLQLPGVWSISGKLPSHCPGTKGCWLCAGPTEAQEYLLEPSCSLNSLTVDATRAGRPAQPLSSPDLMEVRCGQEEISYIAHSPWKPCLHVGPLSPLCDSESSLSIMPRLRMRALSSAALVSLVEGNAVHGLEPRTGF